ncbi:MAG TPA: hypothetical protein PLR18_03505, partial [bacterium]|nr:hypothetical protein [bacterium]
MKAETKTKTKNKMPYKVDNNINNNIKSVGGDKSSRVVPHGYFLLSELEGQCEYSQEYLSLLARKGELKAKKFGRNWYATKESLVEYTHSHAVKVKEGEKAKNTADRKETKLLAEVVEEKKVASQAVIVEKRTQTKTGQEKKRWQSKIRMVKNKINNWVESQERAYRRNAAGTKILERQLIIRKIIDKTQPTQRTIAAYERAENKVHYPMKQGLNRAILEEAKDLVERQAERPRVKASEWFSVLVLDRVRAMLFHGRIAIQDFWRAPEMTVKYWPVLRREYKFRTAAYGLAVFLFLIISGASVLDYQGTNKNYERLARVTKENSQMILVAWLERTFDWQTAQEQTINEWSQKADRQLAMIGDNSWLGRTNNYFQKTSREAVTKKNDILIRAGQTMDKKLARLADGAGAIGKNKNNKNQKGWQAQGIVAGESTMDRSKIFIAKVGDWWQKGTRVFGNWGNRVREIIWPSKSEEIYLAEMTGAQCFLTWVSEPTNLWQRQSGSQVSVIRSGGETVREKETVIREIVYQGPAGERGDTGPAGPPGRDGVAGISGGSGTGGSTTYIYPNIIAQPTIDPHSATSLSAMNLSGETLVVKMATVGEDLTVGRNATIGGIFNATGAAIFGGAVSFNSQTNFAGPATFNMINASSSSVDNLIFGNATTTGTLAVNEICIGGECQNAWPASGTSGAWENIFDNTLSPTSTTAGIFVTGSSTIAADFRVDGNATTTGSQYVGGDLIVIGGANLDGLTTIADARVAVLNATSSLIDNLVVSNSISVPAGSFDYTSLNWYWSTTSEQYFWNNTSTWSGFQSEWNKYTNASSTLITLNDIDTSLKISDIVGDETGTGSLVFGTSPVISGATLNGLSTIADARVAVLNATSSTIDNLVVTNSLSLPAGSFDYTSLNWYWSTTSEQ